MSQLTYRQRKAMMGTDPIEMRKHKERAAQVRIEKPIRASKNTLMRWHEIARRFPLSDRRECRPIRAVELGAYRGHNAENLLDAMPTLRLTLIDAWGNVPLNDGSTYVDMSADKWTLVKGECMRRISANADRVTVIEGSTKETHGIEADLDFVFVDADHSYEGCRDDIAAWWPMVKAGGYLCGHDYGPKPEGKERYEKPGVTAAVNEFVESSGLDLVTGSDGTWFLQKPSDPVRVISFWHDTDESGSYYEQSAKALKDSLIVLGIKHKISNIKKIAGIEGLEGRDKWLAVARHKVEFIRKELSKGKPVIWCDADCVIDRMPCIPSGFPVAAVAYRAERTMRYLPLWHSGFLYLDGSQESREIVAQWAQELSEKPDDHIALDTVLKRHEGRIASLAHEYCWRGEKTDLPIFGRLRKRTRETKAQSRAAIVAVAFGESIKPLLDAHITSIRCNVPDVTHVVIDPSPPDDGNPCGLPKWASPNHHKLKFWSDYIQAHQGQEVILIDADTIILKDPRIRFDENPDFDICFTDRVDMKHPINGGVVFVRCNERTAAFFDEWLRYDDRVFTDKDYFRQAQRVAMGQNQASLGMLLKDNNTHGCNIDYVPCSVWNSVNSCWPKFNPDACYILHVKNGGLREYVMDSENAKNRGRVSPEVVVRTWNHYAPSGYIRPTLEWMS